MSKNYKKKGIPVVEPKAKSSEPTIVSSAPTFDSSVKVEKKSTFVEEFRSKFNSTANVFKWTWAFVLIIGGFLLLLNNFEKIPGSALWEIGALLLKLWPVLLVLAGIQIIFDKNTISKIFVSIVVIMILGLVVSISMFKAGVTFFRWVGDVVPAAILDITDMDYASEKYLYKSTVLEDDIEKVEYNYNFAVSEFTIRPATVEDQDEYVVIDGMYFKDMGKPYVEESQFGSVQSLSFDNGNRHFRPFTYQADGEKYTISYLPYEKMAFNLDVNAASGKATLDDGEFRDLIVKLNVGDLNLKLGKDAMVDFANLDLNVGNCVFDIEGDVANFDIAVNVGSCEFLIDESQYRVRIDYNVSVGSLNVFGDELKGNGTKVYGDGEKEIDFTIKVDVGDVNITAK